MLISPTFRQKTAKTLNDAAKLANATKNFNRARNATIGADLANTGIGIGGQALEGELTPESALLQLGMTGLGNVGNISADGLRGGAKNLLKNSNNLRNSLTNNLRENLNPTAITPEGFNVPIPREIPDKNVSRTIIPGGASNGDDLVEFDRAIPTTGNQNADRANILNELRNQRENSPFETANGAMPETDLSNRGAKKIASRNPEDASRIAPHVDEILQAARKTDEIISDDGRHGFAKDGWTYPETAVRMPGGEEFSVRSNIARNGDKNSLYDIQLNENKRTSPASFADNSAAGFVGDDPADIVANQATNVNPRAQTNPKNTEIAQNPATGEITSRTKLADGSTSVETTDASGNLVSRNIEPPENAQQISAQNAENLADEINANVKNGENEISKQNWNSDAREITSLFTNGK